MLIKRSTAKIVDVIKDEDNYDKTHLNDKKTKGQLETAKEEIKTGEKC